LNGLFVELSSALDPELSKKAGELAIKALLPTMGTRRWDNLWLGNVGIMSPAVQSVVEMLIGLLVADEPISRRHALRAIGCFFSKHPAELQEVRIRALEIVRELAVKDLAWSVRCEALFTLPVLSKTMDEITAAKELVNKAKNSNVAIERRVPSHFPDFLG
jgi:hypothetical protein